MTPTNTTTNAAPAERADIAVSGASFTGLAMALAVARTCNGELSVALVDRTAVAPLPPQAGVRAFAISAASRHMLEALGVWPMVAAEAEPVLTIDITDSPLEAGVRPVVLSYDNLTRSGEPATHIVPSSVIMSALLDKVRAEPSIRILAPETVTNFSADGAAAELKFAGRPPLRATLVIAAEGRGSLLRERAGIKTFNSNYGQTGIVTVIAHERPHVGRAVQHFLPSGPFAILPLPGNRSCITWSEEAEAARRIMALDDDAFLDEVDLRFGGRLGAIHLDGPRQSWPLELSLARSYVAPRLAVIGDAAHGVHPIAGQGLNLGLRDAAALADVVADAARLGLDFGSLSVLERYEQWRRFDATVSAASFDGLNRLFSNDNPGLRALRQAGLGVVDRLPGLKQAFVEEASGLSGELPSLLKGAA